MKKLFLFITFLILTIFVKAQYPITQNLGADSTIVSVKGALRARLINNNVFADTAAANLQRIRQYPGAFIFTTLDTSIWFRNTVATRWLRLAASGQVINGDSIDYLIGVGRTPGTDSVFGKFFNGVTIHQRFQFIDSVGTFGYGITYDTTCNCWIVDSSVISTKNYVNNFVDSSIINYGDSVSIRNIYNNSITNVTLINGDSCAVLYTGNGIPLDTLCFDFVICSWSFNNDSTFIACPCPDTLNPIPDCDTLNFTPTGLFIGQNGVSIPKPGIWEWGSPTDDYRYWLYHDTWINTFYNKMNFTGGRVYDYNYNFSQRQDFQVSPDIVSFQGNANPSSPNYQIIKLGILFTKDTFSVSPDIPGYYGRGIGYMVGANLRGSTSVGNTDASIALDSNTSKYGGIFINTGNNNTESGSLFGAPAPGSGTYVTDLDTTKAFIWYTNKKLAAPAYGSTSLFITADTTTNKPATLDANGNLGRLDHWPSGAVGVSSIVGYNGLTHFQNGGIDSVRLGGTLNQNTTITGGAFGLILTGTSATVSSLDIANNSIGAGSIVNISSTSTAAASNLQKGLNVALSGANGTSTQSTYGIYSSNSHSGTSSTNYGGYFISSNGDIQYGIFGQGSTYGVFGNGTTNGVYGQGASYGVYGKAANTGATGVSPELTPGRTNGSGVFGITNSSTGWGVKGQSSNGSIAVAGVSVGTGVALYGDIRPTDSSSVLPIISLIRRTNTVGNPGVNGVGGSLVFDVVVNSLGDGITRTSNQLISKWTDVTDSTRTSQYVTTGVINAVTDTLLKMGDYVTLTEATPTKFAGTTVATGKIAGGEIIVTVTADDATEYQARTLRFIWSAVNKAGTTTVTISTPEEVVAVSSGTLSTTITATDDGSGVISFKADASSSLTQTTLRCSYQMSKNF